MYRVAISTLTGDWGESFKCARLVSDNELLNQIFKGHYIGRLNIETKPVLLTDTEAQNLKYKHEYWLQEEELSGEFYHSSLCFMTKHFSVRVFLKRGRMYLVSTFNWEASIEITDDNVGIYHEFIGLIIHRKEASPMQITGSFYIGSGNVTFTEYKGFYRFEYEFKDIIVFDPHGFMKKKIDNIQTLIDHIRILYLNDGRLIESSIHQAMSAISEYEFDEWVGIYLGDRKLDNHFDLTSEDIEPYSMLQIVLEAIKNINIRPSKSARSKLH